MAKFNYWEDCISEAAEECGAVLTKDQIDCIASWVESAHDNYRQATGLDVADRNYSSAKDSEIDRLKDEVKKERSKIHCRTCDGRGRIITQGMYHSSDSECWKCRGAGRKAA